MTAVEMERRINSLEVAVKTLKAALVDQARQLHAAQDQLREVSVGPYSRRGAGVDGR